MSNTAVLDFDINFGLKYVDICQNIFEKEIYTQMFLECISFQLTDNKAKLKYMKIITSKDNFIVEFKINNQKRSFILNDKSNLNENFQAQKITKEEYQNEISKIYQLERYLKSQNNIQNFSQELFIHMKNLFKNTDEFKNYIDILEEKDKTYNYYLSKIYNFA
ncbi:hypothetical protein [Campylobacter insulaenigrae]|uniref:Uncharacterized protein n=2 Tax=Campylobacter insulaenigrae TaxID=260714 RepID=A0A0A8H3Y1_9BACT|nr:hypothetical protein [Campylobacter insulaenigrae]AJC88370.1 hypothetical protein CINS_1426 [Campylobacter insulaenigrae NCTC 12927]MCR6572798.1 hypothetical protein [Campylobacter insulaenigrae]MCR6577574.1 hypothetical protein [Campylobacter insulaenigrae]MCR6578511.1 hypothetical protein [Campylobacter insulaenigrae]MCR6581853.1 hypothetical protein [Campylobacter insulaenigrae]